MKKNKVCLIGFSERTNPIKNQKLIEQLKKQGFEVDYPLWIVEGTGYNPMTYAQRAACFHQALQKQSHWILDVTGGNSANGVIPYLDLGAYKTSEGILFGYSDVSSVLNAVAFQSQKGCVLFQASGNLHIELLIQYFKTDSLGLFKMKQRHGNQMIDTKETVYGGNARSFLKLAGTPYWPDLKRTTLFLESCSGNWSALCSYFAQLEQMGVWKQVNRLILGQFSEMDQTQGRKWIDHVKEKLDEMGIQIPIELEITDDVGHSKDSLAVWIGKKSSENSCYNK